ncbi:hypothetical protein SAE02_57310 [Skermanella aerolata]|uniref:Uncharacterized protein n=2 Tax=Skermanella aerolata TaxID=393310 RepID=A0A512DYL5_9PROT|nr:hypothetical protein [Skermanella aerolata]KJB93081.1 hypothetical protein N826_18725 [Skermanella aerolata KACC 11604]GEO41583.1 hypothetical protein SAE02_57310 [Skermanella aerolata]
MNRIYMALLAVPALLLFSTQNAYAYLDPGTGSMLLQGLIGGIAGGMFAIRLYWSKLKSRFGGGRTPASVTQRDGVDSPTDKAR